MAVDWGDWQFTRGQPTPQVPRPSNEPSQVDWGDWTFTPQGRRSGRVTGPDESFGVGPRRQGDVNTLPGRARIPGSADEDGYQWIVPSATAWPNVKGKPPGPRSRVVGYNAEDQTVRIIFREGQKYEYEEVTPQEWEMLRRAPSTGRYINNVLNHHKYGPASW